MTLLLRLSLSVAHTSSSKLVLSETGTTASSSIRYDSSSPVSVNQAFHIAMVCGNINIPSLASNNLTRGLTLGWGAVFADFLAGYSHVFPERRQREQEGSLRLHASLRLRQTVHASKPILVELERAQLSSATLFGHIIRWNNKR